MTIRTPKPWPEGTVPTPEQWANWFVMMPNGEKLLVAEIVIRDAARAIKCNVMDHEAEIGYLKDQIQLGQWLIAESQWQLEQKNKRLERQARRGGVGWPDF